MDLESVQRLARAALRNLEANRGRIDDLNVYPLVLRRAGVVDAGAAGLVEIVGAPPAEAVLAALRTAHPSLDVEVHEGGQPRYPLLVVAE